MISRARNMFLVTMFLWMASLGMFAVAGTTEIAGIAGISNTAADIARDKGVVGLALFTAIASIACTAYLVRMLFAQWKETITAISDLKDALESRPCWYHQDATRIENHK